MSRNSGAKRDKKKAAKQKLERQKAASKINFDNPLAVKRALDKLLDPLLLTTPRSINDDVLAFCAGVSDIAPFYVESKPELWSRQACCDHNVAEYIKSHEGEIVCGYRIWYNEPNYIEGERHAIWRKGDELRDVSFSPDGEKKFLFVPDIPSRQSRLDDNKLRIRWCKDYQTKKLLECLENAESQVSIQRMSDDEMWNRMLTYEQWLSGKRMPSLLPVSQSYLNQSESGLT